MERNFKPENVPEESGSLGFSSSSPAGFLASAFCSGFLSSLAVSALFAGVVAVALLVSDFGAGFLDVSVCGKESVVRTSKTNSARMSFTLCSLIMWQENGRQSYIRCKTKLSVIGNRSNSFARIHWISMTNQDSGAGHNVKGISL